MLVARGKVPEAGRLRLPLALMDSTVDLFVGEVQRGGWSHLIPYGEYAERAAERGFTSLPTVGAAGSRIGDIMI
jgi:hypothetical protein